MLSFIRVLLVRRVVAMLVSLSSRIGISFFDDEYALDVVWVDISI